MTHTAFLVTLDGAPLGSRPPAESLAELVESAVRHLSGTGRIVTAVRIDGVDEPDFSGRSAAARSLAGTARVELESGRPADLAFRCVSDAAAALQTLASGCRETAHRFRDDDVAGAHADLVALARSIATALAFSAVAAAVAGEHADVAGVPPEPDPALGGHLAALIAAGEAADWIALADILEFDAAPAIETWGGTLTRLASALAS